MSLFERSSEDGVSRGATTIAVLPDTGKAGLRNPEARLAEAVGLTGAIGLNVEEQRVVRLRTVQPATLLGKGQIEDLAAAVQAVSADLVVIDGALSPVQQRNLEKELKTKVIDRTGLILEIFGERAATAEGRLQVELAHLDYQAGRLVRSWTHLERQRGGFGFLGGPGETQIEADRRLIRDRMAKIRRELEDVKRTRSLHRDRRKRAPWPVVALVGYTNAGKSTLFNRLTGSDVMAEDLLFATLDPTMRQISLPGLGKVILSDTVGFVSELPTQLIAAFRATLEEVLSADLILHVRDIAHPDSEAQAADVLSVLAEIGVADDGAPIVEGWNKADLLDTEALAKATEEVARREDVVLFSAVTGQRLDALTAAIAARLTVRHRLRDFTLALSDGTARAWLHAHGQVETERFEGESALLSVRMSDANYARFQRRDLA